MIAIFGINVYLHRPVVDSFLFALALAVGLTPELLPAIVSLTLARGAQQMAASHVIVRRLNSIEDFGSMNVLCSDKTGTLTEGVVRLHAALDADGNASDEVLLSRSSTPPSSRASRTRSTRRCAACRAPTSRRTPRWTRSRTTSSASG